MGTLICLILGFLLMVSGGCNPNAYQEKYNNPQYRCDQYDVMIVYSNDEIDIIRSVESPAKIKDGSYIIYDYLHNFDAKLIIPVNNVKKIVFYKPGEM